MADSSGSRTADLVVATGADLAAARAAAYDGVRCLSFAGAQHRTDIALKAAGA